MEERVITMVTIPVDCMVIKVEDRDNLLKQNELLIKECVLWEKKFNQLRELCAIEAEKNNKTSGYRGSLYVDELARDFGFELPPVVKEEGE